MKLKLTVISPIALASMIDLISSTACMTEADRIVYADAFQASAETSTASATEATTDETATSDAAPADAEPAAVSEQIDPKKKKQDQNEKDEQPAVTH